MLPATHTPPVPTLQGPQTDTMEAVLTCIEIQLPPHFLQHQGQLLPGDALEVCKTT